jgi:hypothetical protein
MGTEERIDDKNLLLKEAADALDVAQRREDATKIAFSMVEKGKVPPFDSYQSLQEKVASLMERDLRVVEEALEMDVDMPELGKVASTGASSNPHEAFFHRLSDD